MPQFINTTTISIIILVIYLFQSHWSNQWLTNFSYAKRPRRLRANRGECVEINLLVAQPFPDHARQLSMTATPVPCFAYRKRALSRPISWATSLKDVLPFFLRRHPFRRFRWAW
jgi:hypothetical protein